MKHDLKGQKSHLKISKSSFPTYGISFETFQECQHYDDANF